MSLQLHKYVLDAIKRNMMLHPRINQVDFQQIAPNVIHRTIGFLQVLTIQQQISH
jgi:hypothetical protein